MRAAQNPNYLNDTYVEIREPGACMYFDNEELHNSLLTFQYIYRVTMLSDM